MTKKRIRIIVASILVCSLGGFAYMKLHYARHDALCSNLWSSAQSGENSAVQLYIDEGADPNCANGEPLRRAKLAEHQDTIMLLKRNGAK